MIGHLGDRVSALLDGRLPAAEEERTWQHVHTCHPCRDAVEREGWVKTQLAQWGAGSAPSAAGVRESLLAQRFPAVSAIPAAAVPAPGSGARPRHVVALGGSALGVAVLGVMALGAVPANAPLPDRRTATTSIVPPAQTPPSPAGASVSTPVVRPADVRVLVRHGNMVP